MLTWNVAVLTGSVSLAEDVRTLWKEASIWQLLRFFGPTRQAAMYV